MSKEAMKLALEDCESHCHAWKSALELALGEATNSADRAYWTHEINAFVRTFKSLKDQVDDTNVVDLIAPVQQEPVATKLETQQFNCFHVSAEDFSKLAALPVGTKLYTSPPAQRNTLTDFSPIFSGIKENT